MLHATYSVWFIFLSHLIITRLNIRTNVMKRTTEVINWSYGIDLLAFSNRPSPSNILMFHSYLICAWMNYHPCIQSSCYTGCKQSHMTLCLNLFFSCYHLFLGHLLCISQYFIFSFNICQGYNFDDSFLGADNVAIIPHTEVVDWGEGGNYAWALRPATFHLILQYPQCSDLWI